MQKRSEYSKLKIPLNKIDANKFKFGISVTKFKNLKIKFPLHKIDAKIAKIQI